MAKRGLGKGLDALFEVTAPPPEDLAAEKEGLVQLAIGEVEPNPNQPRKNFDEAQLNELADSIREHGLLQPIVVTKAENGFYQIVAGERRWRASRKAGLRAIPALVKQLDAKEVMELALIENLQREDLNPVEEALGYKQLMESYQLTQEEISQRVGKSRSGVANALRLLNLSPAVQKLVENGKLSGGHARCVLAVEDKELQQVFAEKIIKEGLSVREAEKLAKRLQAEKKQKPEKKVNYERIELEERLSGLTGTKVRITEGKNKGKIEIEYYGNDEYSRIVSALLGKEWNFRPL